MKTYPNVHKDYNEPAINSFSSITSSFSETSPHVGIYQAAYDIWLNGVASNGSTEVMIWNDNYHQVPAGSVQATVTFGGRSYTVGGPARTSLSSPTAPSPQAPSTYLRCSSG